MIDTGRNIIEKKEIEKYEKAIIMLQNIINKIDWRLSGEYDRKIIEEFSSRIKTSDSIEKKLKRKGCEITADNGLKKLSDIAGVRCICQYVDDVYLIYEMLQAETSIRIVKVKDFIKKPKKTGYRSLHIIVDVPVICEESTEYIKVELQLRTSIMHLWARMDHKRIYKKEGDESMKTHKMLLACAKLGWNMDCKMTDIRKHTEVISDQEPFHNN